VGVVDNSSGSSACVYGLSVGCPLVDVAVCALRGRYAFLHVLDSCQ